MTDYRHKATKDRQKDVAGRLSAAATMLGEAISLVRSRTAILEEHLRAAGAAGVPYDEAEAMVKDLGWEAQAMLRSAYLDGYEVTGADTRMHCLAHRRLVEWIPAPGWWIHVKEGLPLDGLDGSPTDPRGCRSMWNADAPITITRKG
jgi:hypothetical protein